MIEEMRTLKGRGVAAGVAIGRAICIQTRTVEVYRFPLPEGGAPAEVERFEEALRRTGDEVRQLRRQVGSDLGDDLAGIFEAHLLMLQDPSFIGRVIEHIRDEEVNAEWAVHRTVSELEDRFAEIDHEYLRERNEDLRDVSRHLLRVLAGVAAHEVSEIEGDVIVVADDLTPSEAVQLGRQGVRGFALEGGGRTSHTTIIARSLNVPLISGVEGITNLLTDNDPMILDGDAGEVILHPPLQMLADYRQRRENLRQRERELLATSSLESTTRDGVPVALMANIDLEAELEDARNFGAAGIGLYRSEFLYIERSPAIPEEDDHLELYRRVVEAAAPHPAIIRTYDLGGRKMAREVMHTQEENPVLGLRGIRLTLARPDVFRTQLRALFRAGVHGDLWILLPMISTLEEVLRFRGFAGEVLEELARDGVEHQSDYKLGIMIEVPSTALTADHFAPEVDFFAIGTNDLIQYSLAVDRNNEHVADLYQPLHPAILRMLKRVVEVADEAGIDLELCGEMASDPMIAPLLVGLGLRRLSMSPRVVPAIKARIREFDLAELEALSDDCLRLPSASAIKDCVGDFLEARVPQEATS